MPPAKQISLRHNWKGGVYGLSRQQNSIRMNRALVFAVTPCSYVGAFEQVYDFKQEPFKAFFSSLLAFLHSRKSLSGKSDPCNLDLLMLQRFYMVLIYMFKGLYPCQI